MKAKYEGLFDGWEIAIAKRQVNKFQEKYSYFREDEREDLLQECLFCWLKKRDKYDSREGASKETYMWWVVKHRLLKLREKVYAEKRRLMYESESLDEYINFGDKSPSANKKHQPSTFIEPGISLDLSVILKKLTPEQQQICELLCEENRSVLYISGQLKKSRRYISREIQRIRQLFEKEGLKEYLKKNKKF